jgi:hypothetical protein
LILFALQVPLSLSDLYACSFPQHVLKEEMITIVAHFRALVVIFLFYGRNSGQQKREERERQSADSASWLRIWGAQLLECAATQGGIRWKEKVCAEAKQRIR